jgi:hypothetical protein
MIVLPFNRTGPIKEVPFTEEEQLDAVNEIHSAFDAVTLKNCHSAVVGTGGTATASTKVAIVRALKKSQGEGGTFFDVGCGFGHFMLAALNTGFSSACGCELPDKEAVQRGVFFDTTRKHCQMDSVSDLDLMTLEPKVSDSMKLMFLAYRAEMIYLCDVNLEYDYSSLRGHRAATQRSLQHRVAGQPLPHSEAGPSWFRPSHHRAG